MGKQLSTLPTDNFLAVIIPVYNGEQFLQEAVNSVMLQPCKNVEAIIINDGSTDRSLQIALSLAKKDLRITVLTQENQGVSAARNRGIDYCIEHSFKYIAFLDADDVWVKDFYTLDIKNQMESASHDAYQFSYYYGNEDLTKGRPHVIQEEVVSEGRNSQFGSSFCSFIYRLEVLSKYSVRFPIGIRAQEDEVFRYVFLSLVKTLQKYNKAIFIYRSNNSSVCHIKIDPTDRYFSDIIPAWQWAENMLVDMKYKIEPSDISRCMTMRKTFLAEYVTTACQQGLSVKRIADSIKRSGYSDLFSTENTIWVDPKSMNNWSSFWKHPAIFWCKHRVYGMICDHIRKLRNLKSIQHKRYPINIDKMIY